MRADDWIVDFLVKHGITDVFGIPGVVVMDFLYAVDRRNSEITPHLTYHEQGGAFAACGYAQSTGKLGVAYSTRGPGLTNMVTAIADAYYDSVPTMFITAHSSIELSSDMRVLNNQEIDTVSIVQNITKKAVRIDSIEDLQREFISAYNCAVNGRQGPVFLDIYNGLFGKDIEVETIETVKTEFDCDDVISEIEERIKKAKRPIILIGNGARSENCKINLKKIINRYQIPVLSSRAGQDIIPDSSLFYGFVGSRATRYSNFILSKCDLIIAIGNRMSFPTKSKSFSPVVEKAFTIRIDVDEKEFHRKIPNSVTYNYDAEVVLEKLLASNLTYMNSTEWINICNILKEKLLNYDENFIVKTITSILDKTSENITLVCDVGNNSFWITTAYAYAKVKNRILYSGSFGTLGCALPKAIGAHFATKNPSICFAGDQGIQFNIQELELISLEKLPVTIVIMNNYSSGMIMEREIAKYKDHLVHTTTSSGYGFPNFESLANCYGINYRKIDVRKQHQDFDIDFTQPNIIEIIIDEKTELRPSLPIGNVCQNLYPFIPKDLYEDLDML